MATIRCANSSQSSKRQIECTDSKNSPSNGRESKRNKISINQKQKIASVENHTNIGQAISTAKIVYSRMIAPRKSLKLHLSCRERRRKFRLDASARQTPTVTTKRSTVTIPRYIAAIVGPHIYLFITRLFLRLSYTRYTLQYTVPPIPAAARIDFSPLKRALQCVITVGCLALECPLSLFRTKDIIAATLQ